MLRSLRVRDLATIADVTLELGDGLNVLTGETGAGKSMLVDALALLLGDRADRAAVRPGAARSVIEGAFDSLPSNVRQRMEAAGLDPDETVIIRREITAEGRSRAWVNGSPTTIGVLATLGEAMVDLHGQHQTLQLLDARVQRELLDAFAGADAALATVRELHADLVRLRAEAATLEARRMEALRRADWLRHVVDEITAVDPRAGEEDQLALEATRLGQAGTLGEHARLLQQALEDDEGGARPALARAARELDALARIDPETGTWRSLLDDAWANLDELGRRVGDYADQVTEDPRRLAEVEHRRDLLGRLMSRHGGSIESVLAARDEALLELDLVDTAELDLAVLGRRAEAAGVALNEAAAQLTALRTIAAERLGGEVSRLLPRLGLVDAALEVQLLPQDLVGAEGAEQVAFGARLNAGMPARPLARTASGGELARLMLALKVVLARHDAVPTLVFDEVDTGVGGEVGLQVGGALARVAERHQVLVITHLPQVAAAGDRHLRVAKGTRDGLAESDVTVLLGEDRVIELARMLGNPDDAAARRLAASLLRGPVAAR
jgi:DNA repair protein RecN (Recombination protein N)